MKNDVRKKEFIIKIISFYALSECIYFWCGYVIVTLMRKKFVSEYHWIDENEMLDLVAIAQSAPGAIAVNGAIVVGYKLAGIIGIIVSVTATILPPFIIISIISVFYSFFRENIFVALMLEGMQSGVGAVIASVVFEMAAGVLKERKITLVIIMLISFIVTYFFNINVIYVILVCIGIGLIQTFMRKKVDGK